MGFRDGGQVVLQWGLAGLSVGNSVVIEGSVMVECGV